MRSYIEDETGFGDGGASIIELQEIQQLQQKDAHTLGSYTVTKSIVFVPYATGTDRDRAVIVPQPNPFMASLPA